MKKTLLFFIAITVSSSILLAQTWTTVTPGAQGTGKDLTVHNNILFLSSSSAGPYSSANGTSWNPVNNGLSGFGLFGGGISSVGSFLYYGSKNGLYRSSDDGANWTSVNTGLQPTGAANSKAVAATYLFGSTYFCIYQATVSSGGGIYRSTDGVNWSASSTGIATNQTTYQLSKIGSNLYACTNFAIYESTDDGLNWTVVSTNGSKVYNGLFEHSGGRRLVHTTFGMEYSDNNGASWDTLTTAIKSSTVCGFIQGANDTIYSYTANNGIFYSLDTGYTWIDITGDLTSNDVSFMGRADFFNGNLYLATFLAVKSNGAGPTAINEFKFKNLFSAYPNPFTDNINIRNESKLPISIRLINVTGQTIFRTTSSNEDITLTTSGLTSGVYFLNVVNSLSGKIITTQKIIHR
ncbi:MAG: T9SS type A sorting domain-containing protein [Vicingus serpentipes]|nr:T9SS type A sorting domain-containing protein [Vicingus serpentipes]